MLPGPLHIVYTSEYNSLNSGKTGTNPERNGTKPGRIPERAGNFWESTGTKSGRIPEKSVTDQKQTRTRLKNDLENIKNLEMNLEKFQKDLK